MNIICPHEQAALNYFSTYYPAVTQRALNVIINIFSPSWWHILGVAVECYRRKWTAPQIDPYPLILSYDELGFLVDVATEKHLMTDTENKTFSDMLKANEPKYSDFDRMYDILKDDSSKFEAIVRSNCSIIIVNKEPKLISYDYEFARILYMEFVLCGVDVAAAEKYYISRV